jgi:small subunit ribosomal protein S20
VAHSLSAKKRIRQNVRRRARNRARKRLIKADVRAFDEALSAGDAGKAADTLRRAMKQIDQVAAKGTIHKNNAARKKSNLQRKLNALAAKG